MSRRTPFLVAVCALLAVGRAGAGAGAGEACVIRVNGDSVAAWELHFWLEEHRTRVMSRFAAMGRDPNAPDFWAPAKDGLACPAGEIVERALKDIRVHRVLWREFGREGLVRDGAFAAVMAELAQENESRTAAAAGGAVMFGPVALEPRQRYHYRVANLVLALEARWIARGRHEATGGTGADRGGRGPWKWAAWQAERARVAKNSAALERAFVAWAGAEAE